MEIRSKAEFFRLWHAGVLGNRPEVFSTPGRAEASSARFIGIREVGRAGGGRWMLVPRDAVVRVCATWREEGLRYTLDAAAPNENTVLCGEICRTYRGLEGLLAIEPRESMRAVRDSKRWKPMGGALVLALLDRYMDPSSRDDLEALLDLYPDATVEFSCYDCDTGIIPGRNTIFWETRNY